MTLLLVGLTYTIIKKKVCTHTHTRANIINRKGSFGGYFTQQSRGKKNWFVLEITHTRSKGNCNFLIIFFLQLFATHSLDVNLNFRCVTERERERKRDGHPMCGERIVHRII